MPAGPSPNDTNETIRGTYSMHARDISLICDEQPAEGIPARDGGTRVAIRSHEPSRHVRSRS